MNFRTFTLFLFLIITSIIFVSCDFEDPWPEENGVTVGSYISSNPNDPEFVKIVTNEGNEVVVFGERDSHGLPQSVSQINVQTVGGTNSLFFDDSDQLSTYVADNGTVFNYVSTSDGNLAVNIVCNDDATELNVKIDLGSITETDTMQSSIILQDIDGCKEIGFEPLDGTSSIELKSTTANSYLLYVTNCYATNEIDIPYRVLLYNSEGKELIKELNATKVSAGIYEIVLPSSNATAVNENELVDKLNTVLGNYCGVNMLNKIASEQACMQITEQIGQLGISSNVANGIGTACSGIKEALDVYCQLVSGNQADGTTAINVIANHKMVENFTLTDDSYQLKVYFKTIPEKVFDFTLADNLSSDLYAELNTNSTATIKKIHTDPLLPNANEDYTINMLVYCIPIGRTLSISITGDDGFYDEAALEISDESQSSGWYNYTVEGRAGKTRDDIEVRISNGWSSDVVRTLTMSFRSKGSALTGPYESYILELYPGVEPGVGYLAGVVSVDTCPFTGNLTNIITWDGASFVSEYEYKDGKNVNHILFEGKIETYTDGSNHLSGEYSSQYEFDLDGLYWKTLQYVEIHRVPAAVYNDDEAIFLIDDSTPKLYDDIANYVEYTYYSSINGDESSSSNKFGNEREFKIVMKR